MPIVEIAGLIAGLIIIAKASNKSVEYSARIASSLGIPTIIIGLFLISLGTDIPEIANSLISSYSGHMDINVGNVLGSCLVQITLAFGLVAILGTNVFAKRKNILVLGGCAVAAVVASIIAIYDGSLTRIDGLFLIIAYVGLLLASKKYSVREIGGSQVRDIYGTRKDLILTGIKLTISLLAVGVGSVVLVDSVISISNQFGVPEYFISFFAVGIGTSLPELSVALAAVKKGRYGIVVGDIFGSNITDATFALGIGPLFFPDGVSAGLIMPFAIFVLVASALAVGLFAWREKLDKKAALILIAIYLLVYLFVF
jgi:cation:H+ antiporter